LKRTQRQEQKLWEQQQLLLWQTSGTWRQPLEMTSEQHRAPRLHVEAPCALQQKAMSPMMMFL
jgi:hypothetical protein